MHDAIRVRKVRLQHVDELLRSATAAKEFDPQEFMRRITPVLKEWRSHLRKDPHRKILPEKLKATPKEGGWNISGSYDYEALLKLPGIEDFKCLLGELMTKVGKKGPG